MLQGWFWTCRGTKLEMHIQECCEYMQYTLYGDQFDQVRKCNLRREKVDVSVWCVGVSNIENEIS